MVASEKRTPSRPREAGKKYPSRQRCVGRKAGPIRRNARKEAIFVFGTVYAKAMRCRVDCDPPPTDPVPGLVRKGGLKG